MQNDIASHGNWIFQAIVDKPIYAESNENT